MRTPSAAETVRTLTSGTGPARAHTFVGDHPVRHATLSGGDLLLLTRDGSDTGALLRRPPWREVPVAVEVPDTPRLPVTPSRGAAWLVGWARPLSGSSQRCAALDLVGEFTTDELLDVGHGTTLTRVRVSDLWLDGPEGRHFVPLADYRAARPDPLHRHAARLLAHLDYCQRATAVALTRTRVPDATTARPVRLDRYGIELWYTRDGDHGHLRVPFPSPVDAPAQLPATLARLLEDTPQLPR